MNPAALGIVALDLLPQQGGVLPSHACREADHRGSYRTEEERCHNNQFLPCRPRSRSACLVLDL